MRASVRVEPFAQLLEDHLRHRTLEWVAASAPKPEAFKRRVSEIIHRRQDFVTLRVADEISTICGHPEWLALV